MEYNNFLKQAIDKSQESVVSGGFPAGAILVKEGEIIGSGLSMGNTLNDPTSHGEVAAIREVCKKLGTIDLSGTILYTSLEPCSMCLSASMWASIPKIVFACSKDVVDTAYYGGQYQTEVLNSSFTKPIELIYEQDHQDLALDIIRQWEKKQLSDI